LETKKADWHKIIFSPEDAIVFNSSRLLLLFEVLSELKIKDGIDLERLCYYDFFSANPFLVITKDDPMYWEIEVEGFDPNKLEYASNAQRYSTKRGSIKHYLALLLSKGLITVANRNGKLLYEITPLGIETSRKISTIYAIAYRKSVFCIVRKLKVYSDKQLGEKASEWLEAKTFQVDLYDMVDTNE
jgi:predicted transcriptional regulator